MPNNNSIGATNSGDFVVTFSDFFNAFIESAPPYKIIDPNSQQRPNREADRDWGELSNCLSSLAQCICAILLVFVADIVF